MAQKHHRGRRTNTGQSKSIGIILAILVVGSLFCLKSPSLNAAYRHPTDGGANVISTTSPAATDEIDLSATQVSTEELTSAENEAGSVVSDASSDSQITFWGQTTILIQSAGHAAIIDAGSKEESALISSLISDTMISQIDYFILTSPQADCIGNAPYLFDSLTIGSFIHPEIPDDSDAAALLIQAERYHCVDITGRQLNQFDVGNLRITILAVPATDQPSATQSAFMVLISDVSGHFTMLVRTHSDVSLDQAYLDASLAVPNLVTINDPLSTNLFSTVSAGGSCTAYIRSSELTQSVKNELEQAFHIVSLEQETTTSITIRSDGSWY